MMLVEETQVAEAALPIDALKRHLRLGSGFAEDDVQDAVLGSFLRAAMAAIESQTGKSLITRAYTAKYPRWQNPEGQILPLAPVTHISDVLMVDRLGNVEIVPVEDYHLEQDNFDPRLMPTAVALPRIPTNGSVHVRFDAGYGPTFESIPSDLAQAVFLLAAHYYEYRDETALAQGCMPFGVSSLIARYRPVRVGIGG